VLVDVLTGRSWLNKGYNRKRTGLRYPRGRVYTEGVGGSSTSPPIRTCPSTGASEAATVRGLRLVQRYLLDAVA